MSTTKRKAITNPRDSKRPKKDENGQEEVATVAKTLFGITDVVSQLFSFLDPRSLLRFSCVNKDFSSLLTYEHVVRAAMMRGGFGATSLERMVLLINHGLIWVPSPIRLLRVVCGKRCEKCSDGSPRYASASFGVFLCDKCIEACTTPIEHWKKPILAYKRAPLVCFGPRKGPWTMKKFFFKSPMKDRTSEDIGPLVTFQHIQEMITDNVEGLTPKEKVEDHLCDCYRHRPNMDAAEEAILSAVEENKEEASARKAAARETKADGKKRFGEARKQRLDKLLDDLKGLVGDEVPWKSKLDERTWVSQTRFPKRWNVSNYSNRYDFRDNILQAVLKPYQKAPSKVTEKRLREIAAEIQNVFDTRALMDQYIQRMVDFADHPEAQRVLVHDWQAGDFCYKFYNTMVYNILGEPLKDPRALKEEDLTRLCIEVKKVVHRKEPCDVVLEKLMAKLDGVPFKEDIEQNTWNRHGSWAYSFNQQHIHSILEEPLLAPAEITDEKLEELAEEVRSILELKQEAHRKVELVMQPTRNHSEWTSHPDSRWGTWSWCSKRNSITFSQPPVARGILNEKFSDLDNLTDATIVSLSKKLQQAFGEE
mmetsp:Transcript_26949/g.65440  ORF Transcript_26949/g.65440 Transcript_26949/m.65440 type:complete len:593 (-) Transcript_26949:121-1899(-)